MSSGTVAVHAPEAVWEDTEPDVEGLLDEWLVVEGEAVAADQAIASIMVVKTSLEIVSPTAGTIDRILVPKGSTFGREDALATVVPAS